MSQRFSRFGFKAAQTAPADAEMPSRGLLALGLLLACCIGAAGGATGGPALFGTGAVLPAQCRAGAAPGRCYAGGHGDGAELDTLSGEVDAECGCLLESSCTHGAAGVAAARRLQLLETRSERQRLETRGREEIAFVRNVYFGAGDQGTAAACRSTCVRGGPCRRGIVTRGRLAARGGPGNTTGGLGDMHGLQTARSSLSVIAKRSARSWEHSCTPGGARPARSVREAHGDLTMMNKLVMPRLLTPSPSDPIGTGSINGELVSRLRGLKGRYEVAKMAGKQPDMDKPALVMLREYPDDSPVSSAAHEPAMSRAVSGDFLGDDSGTTFGAFHAAQTTREAHVVPDSDSWLEEGNAQDRVIPQLVAALLERLSQQGDRALEEDCEVVATSKDGQRSAFVALRRPKVTLADYAERMCKYGACSPGCLGLALVYMDRYLRQMGERCVSGLNVHRLLLSCVLVATKHWDDTHYNNAFWAKVGGVANAELNTLERNLLTKLNFSLLVDKVQWDAYRSALVAWGAVSQLSPDDTSLSAAMSRLEFDQALASPFLRNSRVFACARATLAAPNAPTSDSDDLVAAAGNMGSNAGSDALLARKAGLSGCWGQAGAGQALSPVTPAEEEAAPAVFLPEGPGSSLLNVEESEACEPTSEDIYKAAAAQMFGGMRPVGRLVEARSERCALEQLTGGATCNRQAASHRTADMTFFAHSFDSQVEGTTASNNAVPLQRPGVPSWAHEPS